MKNCLRQKKCAGCYDGGNGDGAGTGGAFAAVERRSGVAQHGAADGGGRVVLRYGLAGSFDPGRAWNGHAPNAVQCLIPTAALLWVLIQRFSIIPAASARLGCTFRVLGALGALLCVGMLCKLLYVPGGTYGCTVQQYGSLAFYFATCHELPQAIFELVRGSVSEQTC